MSNEVKILVRFPEGADIHDVLLAIDAIAKYPDFYAENFESMKVGKAIVKVAVHRGRKNLDAEV